MSNDDRRRFLIYSFLTLCIASLEQGTLGQKSKAQGVSASKLPTNMDSHPRIKSSSHIDIPHLAHVSHIDGFQTAAANPANMVIISHGIPPVNYPEFEILFSHVELAPVFVSEEQPFPGLSKDVLLNIMRGDITNWAVTV